MKQLFGCLSTVMPLFILSTIWSLQQANLFAGEKKKKIIHVLPSISEKKALPKTKIQYLTIKNHVINNNNNEHSEQPTIDIIHESDIIDDIEDDDLSEEEEEKETCCQRCSKAITRHPRRYGCCSCLCVLASFFIFHNIHLD